MKEKFILLILPLILLSCAGAAVQNTAFLPAEKLTVHELKAAIAATNSRAPETLSARMEITGARDSRNYKSAGDIAFDMKTGRLNLTLSDFIFRTPFTMLFKTGESISIYYPLEKKLILTSMKQVQVGTIAGMSVDIQTLVDIASGRIPMIANSTSRQVPDPANQARSCLVLENADCYETISFIEGRPDRILFVWKASKQKIEFYMKDYKIENGVMYYKNMRVISETQKLDVEISFSKIMINKPVQMKSEKDVKMPRDVKVIMQ